MDKLTFRDEIGQRDFVLLNNVTPIVMFMEHYFPLKTVFPYVEKICWEAGYMVIKEEKRIIPALEASTQIKLMAWFKEDYVLSRLN